MPRSRSSHARGEQYGLQSPRMMCKRSRSLRSYGRGLRQAKTKGPPVGNRAASTSLPERERALKLLERQDEGRRLVGFVVADGIVELLHGVAHALGLLLADVAEPPHRRRDGRQSH